MFHLLVKSGGWQPMSDTMLKSRIFEYTEEALRNNFSVDDPSGIGRLVTIPALFMAETSGDGNQFANVGRLIRVKTMGSEVKIDYAYDTDIPPIPHERIRKLMHLIDMDDWEFGRTHWAIKDVDLFRVLLRDDLAKANEPKVFRFDPNPADATLVSAMMPFASNFSDVYAAIQGAANGAGFRCQRADNIWLDSTVIQDIVTLINQSSVVVCDCTGRNANVFYEAGIAHSRGREVILITQSKADIPFDLQHHRYIEYLPNREGLADLAAKLEARLKTLRARTTRV